MKYFNYFVIYSDKITKYVKVLGIISESFDWFNQRLKEEFPEHYKQKEFTEFKDIENE